jgi:hypothetical protein
VSEQADDLPLFAGMSRASLVCRHPRRRGESDRDAMPPRCSQVIEKRSYALKNAPHLITKAHANEHIQRLCWRQYLSKSTEPHHHWYRCASL